MGRFRHGPHSIRASLRHFLWAGTDGPARARVRWADCCAAKPERGLGLINPREALSSLMNKWVLPTLEPGHSALHLLIRHQLVGIQPPGTDRWPSTLHWTLLSRFKAPRGSLLWKCLTQGWRQLTPCLDVTSPTSFHEVLNVSLWWTTLFIGEAFGFSKARARPLAHCGLRCLCDLWQDGTMTLRPWADLQRAYGLLEVDQLTFNP
ncbi:hypothetical protein M758_UG258500 [Ceratodon purpureus]|nr:hypothetical protein M758_UG258500 [Ceratodon purpureus]